MAGLSDIKRVQSIIKEKFIENYQKYIDYLISIEPETGTEISCRYGNSTCTYKPGILITKLEKIYAKFTTEKN